MAHQTTAGNDTMALDGQRPPSLIVAVRLIIAMIVTGGLTTVLVILRQDDLIRVWAEGNPAVRTVLESRGLQAVKDGSIEPPRFIPVAITEYVVLAGLIAILAVFLRNGFEWARVGITVLLFFTAVGSVAGFMTGQPVLFSVCSGILIALFVALIVPLWHPATTAYIHPRD